MDLLFLLICITDGLVIGTIVSLLCKKLLGDRPFARLLRLLLCVASGILYSYQCIHMGFGDVNATMDGFLIFLLTPIAVLVIALVISYMFKGNPDEGDSK